MIFSTKVKAITSIEKVRVLGVGYRGPWKWTAGTRKMEVGGRWCSIQVGDFLFPAVTFQGYQCLSCFFKQSWLPYQFFLWLLGTATMKNYYVSFDLVFLVNFLCETVWRLINYSLHQKAFLWRNMRRFRLVHPWSVTARPWKGTIFKRKVVFQSWSFRGYVKFCGSRGMAMLCSQNHGAKETLRWW